MSRKVFHSAPEFPVGLLLFHTGATAIQREIKRVRVKHRPPAELIWDTMRRRGWAVINLADHMEGDRLLNRFLMSMLFRDPAGRTVMGSVLIHRIAKALDLPPAQLEKLERDWIVYREKLTKSGRRLVGESWRRRRRVR
jgi:hypothetical protein